MASASICAEYFRKEWIFGSSLAMKQSHEKVDLGRKRGNLFKKPRQVDDYTVTNHALGVAVEDARRYQV